MAENKKSESGTSLLEQMLGYFTVTVLPYLAYRSGILKTTGALMENAGERMALVVEKIKWALQMHGVRPARNAFLFFAVTFLGMFLAMNWFVDTETASRAFEKFVMIGGIFSIACIAYALALGVAIPRFRKDAQGQLIRDVETKAPLIETRGYLYMPGVFSAKLVFGAVIIGGSYATIGLLYFAADTGVLLFWMLAAATLILTGSLFVMAIEGSAVAIKTADSIAERLGGGLVRQLKILLPNQSAKDNPDARPNWFDEQKAIAGLRGVVYAPLKALGFMTMAILVHQSLFMWTISIVIVLTTVITDFFAYSSGQGYLARENKRRFAAFVNGTGFAIIIGAVALRLLFPEEVKTFFDDATSAISAAFGWLSSLFGMVSEPCQFVVGKSPWVNAFTAFIIVMAISAILWLRTKLESTESLAVRILKPVQVLLLVSIAIGGFFVLMFTASAVYNFSGATACPQERDGETAKAMARRVFNMPEPVRPTVTDSIPATAVVQPEPVEEIKEEPKAAEPTISLVETRKALEKIAADLKGDGPSPKADDSSADPLMRGGDPWAGRPTLPAVPSGAVEVPSPKKTESRSVVKTPTPAPPPTVVVVRTESPVKSSAPSPSTRKESEEMRKINELLAQLQGS